MQIADSAKSNAEVYEDAVAENLQREDLSAIELAEAFRHIAITVGCLKEGVDEEAAREHPPAVRLRDIDTDKLATPPARPTGACS